MIKNVISFVLTSTAIFGLAQAFATEIYPFFLERQDRTILEGYFLPPSTQDAPIIFAIQGSSCKSALKWCTSLFDQVRVLGLGAIVLEKQGISHSNVDLQQRQEDYMLCLKHMNSICPEWEGRPVFWGESEGGTLAANLAARESETAAVLLFGMGGGMKPREEVKWMLRHRLEQQEAEQEEIELYMNFLDEQMDAMILDPSADKQFLGNTYTWWASFLSAEEAATPLNQQSLPIYLVHSIEDNLIPIQSADLAAEMLSKTNALTYLRLEGRGHDLNTVDVQDAACRWLSSILFQQPLFSKSKRTLSKNIQASPLDYIFCRTIDTDTDRESREERGEYHGSARGTRDTDGNERIVGDIGLSYDFGNGLNASAGAGGFVERNREGDVRGGVHAELEISRGF